MKCALARLALPRRLATVVFVFAVAGCGPVRVATLAIPEGKTNGEQQMDELECAEYSKPGYVPLLFGAGVAIARKITKNRYADCMEGKGYAVAR